MVLKTQRCPGAPAQHHQESSGRIQGGGYSSFSAITGQTTPYSSENSQHHQSGGYHGSGIGVVATGLNQSSYHGQSQSHGHNGYGNGPTYGYQKHSWTLKKLDVE
ncbi:hypothetical protein L1887_29837 [Cichorium endivia]|nr:hypothetical protein L1887_29837 [Cichorium endivia]